MESLSSRPRLSRTYRLQWEEAQGNYVLLYPEGMIKLNQSAAEILKRCDGSREIAAIVSELEAAFSQTGIDAEIREFLNVAAGHGWLV